MLSFSGRLNFNENSYIVNPLEKMFESMIIAKQVLHHVLSIF